MKSLRSLLALFCAVAFAGSVAFAGHHEGKKSDSKPAKAACGCETGKDGKVCGTDKDCCCTGEKAKGHKDHGSDKKAEGAKADEKKADAKKDKPAAGKTGDAACPPCEACA